LGGYRNFLICHVGHAIDARANFIHENYLRERVTSLRMHFKARGSQRLCLLLAILVMGQEFNVVLANYVVDMKEGLQEKKANKKSFEDWESSRDDTGVFVNDW
jgi:hypothetical protein